MAVSIAGSEPGTMVEVTVGIPTRDAGPLLERVLRAVFGQRTEKRFEVVALDSGSTDGTLETLDRHGVRVVPIPRDSFDWGATRERLFEEARGDIVVNLSQDAVPAHDAWLDRLVEPLGDPEVGASSGSSIPDPERPERQFQWERNGYYYFTREIQRFVARYGKGLSFANAAVPRRVWERFHIAPQATGEDFQFQMKLHGAGLRIAFPEDAPVYHHHHYTLRQVYKRCRNEGLALREMGCRYTELDLLIDLAGPRKYVQWLREAVRGGLRSPGEWLYPVLRHVAVYAGSRFGAEYAWY